MPSGQRLFVFVITMFFAVFIIGAVQQAQFAQHNQHYQQSATKDKAEPSKLSPTSDINERIAQYTFWLMAFTAVLAAATIGLGMATVKLWLTSEKHATHMESSSAEAARAATAMESVAAGIADSVTNAQQMAATQREFGKLQMRPYIALVDPAFIAQDIARPYFAEIQLIMANTGHTPAHNIRFFAKADVQPLPLPDNFDFTVSADQIFTSGHINPGQRLYFRRNIGRILPQAQYDDILAGRGTQGLYIWGTIFFEDVFGDSHQTNFCAIGVWDINLQFSTRNTAQHNDAT